MEAAPEITRTVAIGPIWFTVPIATVLVISGAASTAMCADLGARTIREELDALRVMASTRFKRW
ncbi:hypothetical protein MAHJHV63_50690 [Mycobacterium avium subsp. hominissuis]